MAQMSVRPLMRHEERPTFMFMRQLLLLRHAKSSWDNQSMPDRDRPLNARGRQAAAAMRDAMRDLGLAPDLVLFSPARRTRETVEALEPWDEAPLIEPIDSLYLATAGQMLGTLHGVPETARSVLLVGHNPGLHELALLLLGSRSNASQAAAQLRDGYPTGTLTEFNVPGPWWQLDTGGGQLVRFLRPRDLPEDETETARGR
jgi:phosphohistidine phosphatase